MFFTAFSDFSLAQNSASLKVPPVQLKQSSIVQIDISLPIEIPKIYKKDFSYWKLTSDGFYCYADGRYFYEESYFESIYNLYKMFGGLFINNNINGIFDFRFSSFYPMRRYDFIFKNIIPVRNYTQYNRIINTSVYVYFPTYFILPSLSNNSYSYSENTDKEINSVLKPVKLIEIPTQSVNSLEIRKVKPYEFEKTKYDVTIDRSLYWINRDDYTSKYSKRIEYNTSKSGTGINTSNSGNNTESKSGNNNGSKSGNNGTKSTETSKKKSE